MIEVRGLCKRFGERTAITDVSFCAAPGEVVGLLGPNGSGKTTTMRILAGSLVPSAGSATVAGFDVVRQSQEARARLGYLPELPPLYRELKVREYLRYLGQLKRLGRRVGAAVDAAIGAVGLAEVATRLIGELSRGFQQRVALAQALLGDPQALILDEPTSGLDPRQTSEVRALVKGLAGSRTVLLSTHLLAEVVATCDRVVILRHGQVVRNQALAAFARAPDGAVDVPSLEREFLSLTEA
jgi:ABC-2 type transport system ATP-binding protein